MNLDEVRALFEQRRVAWLAEDFDTYLGLFDQELVIEVPGRDPIHGLPAYAELVRTSYEHVRPVAFDFHALALDGPRVLSEWTITIEWRADGRQVSYRGMSICTLRDGRIASWREYYDPAPLRAG